MSNSIYTGLSRQVALQKQMDLVANNVANMSTPGYRAQNMVFTEFISDPEGAEEPLSQVLDYGHFQKTEAGPIKHTGNPLDLALQGRGYFGVQAGQGTMYTRAGNFQINANGELVTGRGDPVASDGGGTIVIPADATEVRVDENGMVATDAGQIGQIMVVEFDNEQDLEAMGNGLYSTAAEARPADETRVMQGMLEGSNVTPVLEMTRMIDVLRSYQSTQRMMQNEHERERTMIQRLTRT